MNIFFRRIIWLIMLIPAIYLAIIWKTIPEKVPMHFDLKGNVDRYGTKHEFLVLIAMLTVINVAAYLAVSNIYKIDPRKGASLNKDRMKRMAFAVSVYLSAIWVMLIYQIMHNDVTLMMKFVFVAMGLLFALLGNYMYNIQPNYFAGIRLPWTLESEDNWRKTHHLAGRLWFFGGLAFGIVALLLNKKSTSIVVTPLIAILVIIPIIYSYNLYKKSKR